MWIVHALFDTLTGRLVTCARNPKAFLHDAVSSGLQGPLRARTSPHLLITGPTVVHGPEPCVVRRRNFFTGRVFIIDSMSMLLRTGAYRHQYQPATHIDDTREGEATDSGWLSQAISDSLFGSSKRTLFLRINLDKTGPGLAHLNGDVPARFPNPWSEELCADAGAIMAG